MASSPWSPDVWRWITTVPPISRWLTDSLSLPICTPAHPQPPLTLAITRKSSGGQNHHVIFSLAIDLQLPISLWTCSPFHIRIPNAPLGEDCVLHLFHSAVNGVLKYGPKTKHRHTVKLTSLPSTSSVEAADAVPRSGGFSGMFNLAFLTLVFQVCTYEAPGELRDECLGTLKQTLMGTQAREASKALMRILGSNMEEQWMRSINLAITNRAVELLDSGKAPEWLAQGPCRLFSYALSALGFWKVQFYCPVIAMGTEDDSRDHAGADDRLLFSLRYQQLEGVVQLAYRVTRGENWFNVVVSVDNIRCDVVSLLPKSLMRERGLGPEEKHFPSRVSLQLTPTTQQHHVMSVSVSKSSDNPAREVGLERGMEGGFDPPNPYLGLRVSASETVTMSVRPWKFEQWVVGNTASLGWYLHDEAYGREVVATRPSKLQMLLQPRSLWFRDRYSSAHRPFTKQGGVIFAGDEYGESVCWKVGAAAAGRTVEWEITGWIWVTYWPNKHRSFYSETRRLEFRELVQVPIPK